MKKIHPQRRACRQGYPTEVRLSLVYMSTHIVGRGYTTGRYLCDITIPCGLELYRAAFHEEWDAVSVLIGLGSDANYCRDDRTTVLDLVIWSIPSRTDLIELLLSAGANPNRVSGDSMRRIFNFQRLPLNDIKCLLEGWSEETVDRALLITDDIHPHRDYLQSLKSKFKQKVK